MPRTRSTPAGVPATPAGPAPRALKLRMRLMVGEQIAVGPGKVALLEALQRTHSISAAAKSLGMSYRRAWLLIDELNGALRAPAVVSATGGAHGGGSSLTEVGERLVQLYRGIEHEALRSCSDDVDALLDLLAP